MTDKELDEICDTVFEMFLPHCNQRIWVEDEWFCTIMECACADDKDECPYIQDLKGIDRPEKCKWFWRETGQSYATSCNAKENYGKLEDPCPWCGREIEEI